MPSWPITPPETPTRRAFEARDTLARVNSSSEPIVSALSANLNESDLAPDPIAQFDQWLQRALDAGLPEPTAMTLATANRHGMPSARIVLLKEFDERGFTFFTNYGSQKGKELTETRTPPWFTGATRTAGSIVGKISRVTREESDRYFRRVRSAAELGVGFQPKRSARAATSWIAVEELLAS